MATPTIEDMIEFCNEFNGTDWNTANAVCSQFVRNEGGMTFTKLSGMAIADMNNDGFHDITTTHEFGSLRFFYNIPSSKAQANRFITFKLVGDPSATRPTNVYGIGATVILISNDENGKPVKQWREISSYQHTSDRFGSKEDRIIFGLGQNLIPSRIIVKWPNRKKQDLSLDKWEFSGSSKDPIEILDRGSK